MNKTWLILWFAAWAVSGMAAGEVVSAFESAAAPVPLQPIDRLVAANLTKLGIQPVLCSDAVFVRRVYLDVIGTLPTAVEARQFIQDPDLVNKRAQLIDRLLERDEFSDYWAMRWGDVLRIKAEFPVNLWPNAAQAYHRWLRSSIADNKPYDQFVRELLTASGSNFRVGPVNFFRAIQNRKPDGIATAVALTLMGTRAEAWPAERLAGMAAFFLQLGYKPTNEWKEEHVFWDPLGSSSAAGNTAPGRAAVAPVPAKAPAAVPAPPDRESPDSPSSAKPPAPPDRESPDSPSSAKPPAPPSSAKPPDSPTSAKPPDSPTSAPITGPAPGRPQVAVFPDGKKIELPLNRDPRDVFADWLLAPNNPWLARNIVNRYWAWLLGRGIIHEPDDIRPDNPASNPALLAYLEGELVAGHYDLKRLCRLILNSQTYQLSSVPRFLTPAAAANFASYPLRRLDAEVLIDAINRITGASDLYTSAIPEPFTYIPEDQPAIALPDGSITSPFLALFGRSARATGMVSERDNKSLPAQWLYLLNSSHIQRKLEQSAKLKAVLDPSHKPETIIDELYLTILSRFPTVEEVQILATYGQVQPARPANPSAPPIVVKRREDWLDLAWALINSTEFLYRH